MILEILTHTPSWVFVLFAYLAWIGIKRLQPGTRRVTSVWIAPLIFIVWGVSGLFAQHASPLWWLLGAVPGLVLGLAFAPAMQVDRRRMLVRQPGSAVPLARNLLLFGSHYVLRASAAAHPLSQAGLLAADVVVSGLGAGYFAGWAVRFALAWRSAPQVDLAAAA